MVESRVQSRKQPIFAAQGIQNSTRDPALLTDNLNYHDNLWQPGQLGSQPMSGFMG